MAVLSPAQGPHTILSFAPPQSMTVSILNVMPAGHLYQVDPFPHEDIVWGTSRAKPPSLFFRFPSFFPNALQPYKLFVDHHVVLGIAYTIDPTHATEVRAYLGAYCEIIFRVRSFQGYYYTATHLHAFYKTTAKRYSTALLIINNHCGARDVYRTSVLRARLSIQTHSIWSSPCQDGYTLERVDVYGLVDGVRETVVIPGAECYVGRNDNPSFSSSILSPAPRLQSVSYSPPLPSLTNFFFGTFLVMTNLQLVRSRSANFRKLSGVPWVRQAQTRYVTVLSARSGRGWALVLVLRGSLGGGGGVR